MPTSDQSGIRRTYTYWVEETQSAGGDPQTPTDPSFKLWSKSVLSAGTDSSGEFEESLGLGTDIAHDKNRGVESHEGSVSYELCRFPEDSSGNTQDPFGYAAKRTADNRLQATLTFLQVIERDSLATNNTAHYRYFSELGNSHPSGSDPGATAGRASRAEIYGRGGRPDDPELSANPGDSSVIEVEMSLMFGKLRKYQIDQPSSAYIHVKSTVSSDTSVPVDIETTDGGTSETVSTDGSDGTTAVASSSTYDSLRVHVDGAFDGTIEVYEDDGSGSGSPGAPGELLTYIRGASTYDGIEHDTGVPMVGGGSFESESSLPSPISALRTGGQFDGSDAAQKIMGSTVSVSNNLEDLAPAGTLTRDIHAGQREIESESTVYGETEGIDKFQDHMEGREGQLTLPTTRGDIVLPRVYVAEGGDTEREEGNAVMQVDVTFRALRPSSGEPLQFNAN